jgi:hypothetical protein
MPRGLFTAARKAPRKTLDFAEVLEQAALPAHETEFVFYPGRRWRFDFAWPAFRIAFEIEGGAFGRAVHIDRGWQRQRGGAVAAIAPGTTIRVGGRHQSGKGFEGDIEKYNAAAIAGWIVLRATTRQVRDGEALAWLRVAFAARKLE